MRRKEVRYGAIALCAGILTLAATATSQAQEKGPAACFERLKSLAGDWMGKGPGGQEITMLRFRVTAGGSALEETEFPGTDHEMVTVFHMDGDRLALTHYCHLGNQPH